MIIGILCHITSPGGELSVNEYRIRVVSFIDTTDLVVL